MKIIHTGDLHLGSTMRTRFNFENAKKRRNELTDAFKRLVDYGERNSVTVVILAGDIFDNKKVMHSVKNEFLRIVAGSKLDFIYVTGNHDEDVLGKEDEIPANLYLGTNNWQRRTYDDVTVSYVNFNDESEKKLYDELDLPSDKKNIVVLHGDAGVGERGKIQLAKLRNVNIDYLALGHIHKNSVEKLSARGIYAYCGCLAGRGFDEDGEKGFYLLDTNNITEPVFVKSASRAVHKIPVDITGCTHWGEFEDRVAKALDEVSRDDIVRIIIKGKYNPDVIKKEEMLAEKLSKIFFIVDIKDLSHLELNVSDYADSPTFKAQFIKMVNEAEEYSEEEKEKIISTGLHALLKEEI